MPLHAQSDHLKGPHRQSRRIAVRVIRACRDAGWPAWPSTPSRTGRTARRMADEAYALGGQTSAESYLDIAKILGAAAKSGADAVHPGYGFLSENADFAQAVLDAGPDLDRPPPAAIDALGDKVNARHIALRAGAPLVPGTPGPGHRRRRGRGLRPGVRPAGGDQGRLRRRRPRAQGRPHHRGDPGAVRLGGPGGGRAFGQASASSSDTWTGRGTSRPSAGRPHGNVVVARTRDCSLQRRHQKLVEEARPRSLPGAAQADPRLAPKRSCKEAGYYGAGTASTWSARTA